MIIKKILRRIFRKEMIQKQQEELFLRIESNIIKGNNVLFDDLMEWEKNTENIQEKYKLFKKLEKKSMIILRKRFMEEVNMFTLVLQANLHLYKRNFTLDELKILLKFYNTKVGKKTILIGPELLASSQELMAKQLVPITTRIAKDVQQKMVQEFIMYE